MKLTAIEAAALVGRNERRIRAWIESGRLVAEKLDGEWQIERDEVMRVATALDERNKTRPGHGVELEARLTALEERVKALESRLAAQDDRRAALDIVGVQPATPILPSRLTGLSTRWSAPTPEFSSKLPDGLVAWRPFVREHGIHHTSVLWHIENGNIPLVRGRWQVGRNVVTQAFAADGVREFLRLYSQHPKFARCLDCPHEPMEPETKQSPLVSEEEAN